MNGNHDNGPIDLVAREDACPNCGERDADQLVWIDADSVECQTCKTRYSPPMSQSADE